MVIKRKKVTGDTLSGRISLVSYQDVNEKQLKNKLDKNGIYLSKELADTLKIKEGKNYNFII